MAKATTAAKAGKATKKAKVAPVVEEVKASVIGIDDMVNAIFEDIQADTKAPASAKELTKVVIKAVLKSEQEMIKGAVANGDKVAYIGFGTYEQRQRSERKGRNPQTGEEMTIEASTVPAFKPGKGFKDAVK